MSVLRASPHYFLNVPSTVAGRTKTWYVQVRPTYNQRSTIAAAEFYGYDSIGIEIDQDFFEMARRSIPKLAKLRVHPEGLTDTPVVEDSSLIQMELDR